MATATSYYAKKLREADLKGEQIPEDATDEEVFQYWRETQTEGAGDEEVQEYLETSFGKPPAGVLDIAKGVVEFGKALPGAVVEGVKSAITSPARTGQAYGRAQATTRMREALLADPAAAGLSPEEAQAYAGRLEESARGLRSEGALAAGEAVGNIITAPMGGAAVARPLLQAGGRVIAKEVLKAGARSAAEGAGIGAAYQLSESITSGALENKTAGEIVADFWEKAPLSVGAGAGITGVLGAGARGVSAGTQRAVRRFLPPAAAQPAEQAVAEKARVALKGAALRAAVARLTPEQIAERFGSDLTGQADDHMRILAKMAGGETPDEAIIEEMSKKVGEAYAMKPAMTPLVPEVGTVAPEVGTPAPSAPPSGESVLAPSPAAAAPSPTAPLLQGPEQALSIAGTPAEQAGFQAARQTPVGPPAEGMAPTPRPEGNPEARMVVEGYTRKAGIPKVQRELYPKLDKEKARTIAKEYERLQDVKPGTPEYEATVRSYDALNREIAAQYQDMIDAGYTIEFTTDDPYPNSAAMRKDVAENRRLRVFASGEGHHPYMSPEETNRFRAVHDFFGHAAEGFEFGPRGEDAAWRQHAATLSDEAIPALTTETRGQNAWVNFLEANEKLSPKERPFAKQKLGLLPRFTYEEVLHAAPTAPSRPRGAIAGKAFDFAEKAGEALRARTGGRRLKDFLKDEGGELDSRMYNDLSLWLAGKFFTLGDWTAKHAAQLLKEEHGEFTGPEFTKIYEKAQRHATRFLRDPATGHRRLKELMELGASGRHGMNWYEETANWAAETFGDDADLMLKMLAVTSANGQTEAGAALALKAYQQHKLGQKFHGMRGESMVGQLNRIVKGENLGDHTKIENFYRALKGDPDAVVLDRWMMAALGLKGKGGSLRENDYRIYAQVVRELAEREGMSPRQFQAAVWEGARIAKAHETEAKGGKRLTTKSGSAYPLEALVDRKLGGMKPAEWVEANKLTEEKLRNLYEGMKPVRDAAKKGEMTGYTFDPSKNFATRQPKDRLILTLATETVPSKEFYPEALLKFYKQFEPLIQEMSGSATPLNVGVYTEKSMGGSVSLDLNVEIPKTKRAAALKFAKINRVLSIGETDADGNYVNTIPSGYKITPERPQFTPPKGSARIKWFKEANDRARASIRGIMKGE